MTLITNFEENVLKNCKYVYCFCCFFKRNNAEKWILRKSFHNVRQIRYKHKFFTWIHGINVFLSLCYNHWIVYYNNYHIKSVECFKQTKIYGTNITQVRHWEGSVLRWVAGVPMLFFMHSPMPFFIEECSQKHGIYTLSGSELLVWHSEDHTFAADSVQQVLWFAACIAVCNTWSSGGTALCRVWGATSQLDLPSLTPLSVAGCGSLQPGAPHWATSVNYCK